MTFEVHASIESDLTHGFATHKTMVPLPVPTIIIAPSIEVTSPMNHAPSEWTGKAKLTKKTFFNELRIVQASHDLSIGLPHFVQPPSPMMLGTMLTSSRKVVFSAARVHVDGKPVGGAQVGTPLLPMVTCSEPVSAPTAFNTTSSNHNLIVGFTASDIAFGIVGILTSAALSALFGPAFDRASLRIFGRKLSWGLSPETAARVKQALGFADPSGLAKLVFGSTLEGALSYARGQVDGTHDWSVKYTVGGPALSFSVSYAGSDDRRRAGWSFETVRAGHRSTVPLSESLRQAARRRDAAHGSPLNQRGVRSR